MVLTCLDVFGTRTQAEGHYFIMVHHIFDFAKNRNVMKMWKLGGAGQHQNFRARGQT
jgi:hypothetical protein